MALLIGFDRSITRAASIELGPFQTIELTHRRIMADGRRIAMRKASGVWAIGGGFLEVRIRAKAGKARLSLLFAEPWRNGEVRIAAHEVRLVGDRLWTDGEENWLATDQEEERAWVVEPGGEAYDRVLAA